MRVRVARGSLLLVQALRPGRLLLEVLRVLFRQLQRTNMLAAPHGSILMTLAVYRRGRR